MDIFVQIGFVVLVGLACKNAILIVEFARQLRDEGKPLCEATTDACRLRLRPILMTSFAFILGVLPMVVATGAGAEMRWSLGTAVFSGMLGVTLFGILLTPVFFFVIESLGQTNLFRFAVVRWVVATSVGPVARACRGLPGLEGRLPASALGPGRRRNPRAARRPWRRREAIGESKRRDIPLLHRSSHLRLGAVDHPDDRRGGGRLHAAHCPVPRGLAADGAGDGQLSRRQREDRARHRGRARSSSRSAASRTCSTCRRNAPTTARTSSP